MIEKMKKIGVMLLFFAGTAAPGWADYPFPDIFKKFEVSLFGGLAWPKIAGTTSYADVWNHLFLTRVEERTSIRTASAGSALSLGAAVSYFFGPKFGLQVLAGYASLGLETTSDIRFKWTWSPDAGGGSFAKSAAENGTGKILTIPVGLNLVARFPKGNFEAFVSGGPTMTFFKITADTVFGYGVSKTEEVSLPSPMTVQYVDALGVGLELKGKTWAQFGGKFGAGLVYKIGESLGLSLEVRYFACPAKTLAWDFVLGSYDGLFNSPTYPLLKNIPFDESDVGFVNQAGTLSGLTINPSFFQLLAGLKIFFGD
jgi:opacity protein-like surface antigen